MDYIQHKGLNISEETLNKYYLEILTAARAEEACATCRTREECPLNPPGFGINIHAGGSQVMIAYYICDKEQHYQNQRKIQRILESSRMPELYREWTFDNYIVTEGTKDAYEAARRYCQSGGKGLLFAGPCGVGKSHLAAAIMNDQAAKGREFAFCTTPELLDDIRRAIDNKQETSELIELVKNIDLLFLDDFGAEQTTNWVIERFFIILNARLTRKKDTIITTNYTKPSQLIEKMGGGVLGQRLISRIRQMCSWIIMAGEDWRLKL